MSTQELINHFRAAFAEIGPFPGANFDTNLSWRDQRNALAQQAAESIAVSMLEDGGYVRLRGGRGVHGELVQWLVVETSAATLNHVMTEIFGSSEGYNIQGMLRQRWNGGALIDESAAAAADYCRSVRW